MSSWYNGINNGLARAVSQVPATGDERSGSVAEAIDYVADRFEDRTWQPRPAEQAAVDPGAGGTDISGRDFDVSERYGALNVTQEVDAYDGIDHVGGPEEPDPMAAVA